jgi:hypothetical protein
MGRLGHPDGLIGEEIPVIARILAGRTDIPSSAMYLPEESDKTAVSSKVSSKLHHERQRDPRRPGTVRDSLSGMGHLPAGLRVVELPTAPGHRARPLGRATSSTQAPPPEGDQTRIIRTPPGSPPQALHQTGTLDVLKRRGGEAPASPLAVASPLRPNLRGAPPPPSARGR